jgi:phage tail-like protein
MTARAKRPDKDGITVEIKVGKKKVSATFAEFHLSVVSAAKAGKKTSNKNIPKITGLNKNIDVTMKRGVVADQGLSDWLNEVRDGKSKASKVVVTVPKGGPGTSAMRWKLRDVSIKKYVGPELNAKGGGDVAMEELVLSSEKVELK